MADPSARPPATDDVFDERNPFLFALLGLISLSERTLATVVELAPPTPPAPAAAPSATPRPRGPVLR